MKKNWLWIVLLLLVALALYGVQGTMNKGADLVDDVVDTVADVADNAEDTIEDTIEDAVDAAEDAIEDTADAAEDAVEGIVGDSDDDDSDDDSDDDDSDDDDSDDDDSDDAVNVDLEKSTVAWKGTVIAKAKSHNGTIMLKEANVTMDDGALTGGTFVLDTTTIKATDIDNEGLDNHLKASDYFDAENYPTSTLTITEVNGNTVTADLTIKDKTLPVTFDVETAEGEITTSFSINSTKWGVEANGIEGAIVDDDIQFDINLVY